MNNPPSTYPTWEYDYETDNWITDGDGVDGGCCWIVLRNRVKKSQINTNREDCDVLVYYLFFTMFCSRRFSHVVF